MRHLLLAVSLVLCWLLSTSIRAQREAFTSWGPNTTSCGSYLAHDKAGRSPYEFWVLGFVSGTNRERADNNKPDLSSGDVEGMKAWVVKYCGEHPLDTFTTATIALVDELARRAEAK